MADSYRCEFCGDEFDSERGLHVHQGQKHDGKRNEDAEKGDEKQEEMNDQEKSSRGIELKPDPITVSAYNAVLGAFVIGLVFGASLSLAAGGFEISLPERNPLIVELDSGEYPFQGVEAGVGQQDTGIGNSTYYLQGEPYLGSPDAPVKMVSYEDFQCPFCGRFHQNTFPQILENHISTGEVQMYFKNFPLRIHPWADDAAIASECALNQDVKAYWTFNKGFFDNQEALKNTFNQNQTMFDRSMYRWAEQTGLDTEKFRSCYDNREEEQEVVEDLQQGSAKNISATPGFLINDVKLSGAQPYSIFQRRFEEATKR